MTTAQFAPAASELPQLVTSEKSPLTAMPRGIAVVALFVTLTVCVTLETPVTTTALPKVTDAGETVKLGVSVLPPTVCDGFVSPVSKTDSPSSSDSVSESDDGATLDW
jgi:hypothetical protein